MRTHGSFAAVSLAVALVAGPALTWTVSGSPGDAQATSGQITLKNGTVTILCDSGSAAGTMPNGSGLGESLVSSTSSSLSNCKGPAGVTVTISHVGTWTFLARTYVNGVTTGRIGGITATVTAPTCVLTVAGSVGATYTNLTGILKVDPALNVEEEAELTISAVDGCMDLVHDGDHPTASGTFQVDPRTVQISSP